MISSTFGVLRVGQGSESRAELASAVQLSVVPRRLEPLETPRWVRAAASHPPIQRLEYGHIAAAGSGWESNVNRNIELKSRFGDLALGHDIARSIGAALDTVEQQRDTYFAVAYGRLKLRERWTTRTQPPLAEVEHRTVGIGKPAQLIWYHRASEPRARPSDYSLVQLPDGEAMRLLLAGALGVVVQVSKLRTVYLWKNVRIHLDQVVDLGEFLEFEAIVDQSCDAASAEQKIAQLHAAFRLTDECVLSESYADLVGLANCRRCGGPAEPGMGM
jgi:adenylate cyclase class IV